MKILDSVLRLTFFLVSAFALSNSVSVADIAPMYYDELKTKAPEQLTIKVLSVDVTDFVNVIGCGIKVPSKHICTKAEVTAVNHSESGLKPGSTIRVIYTVEVLPENYVGAPETEVLEKGMVRRAYLRQRGLEDIKEQGSYNAAALGHSFESIK
jgi:hypothetical protein